MTDRDGRQNGDESGERRRRDPGLRHPLSPGERETGDERAGDPTANNLTGSQERADSAGRSAGNDRSQTADRGNPGGPHATQNRGMGPPDGESGDGARFSRRQLLGGAGVAAVAAAGAGWWLFPRGPEGSEAVATAYIEAIADNDWPAAGELYHEDSAFGEWDGTYEDFLAEQGALEQFELVSPSVEGLYVGTRVTDVEAAIEADSQFSLSGTIDPTHIEEWQQVRAILRIQTEQLRVFEEEDDFVADTSTVELTLSLVRERGDWYLTQTVSVSPLI